MALSTAKMETNYSALRENWPLGKAKAKFDREVEEYSKKKISELTKINGKLCDKIVVIEVQNIVLRNEIKSLKKYIKDNGGKFDNPAEARQKAWEQAKKAGLHTNNNSIESIKNINKAHN